MFISFVRRIKISIFLVKPMKISIIWAWAFGYSITKYISELHPEIDTFVFDVNEIVISSIESKRVHPFFFTDYIVQNNVYPTWNLEVALTWADLMILALPSHHIRNFIKSAKAYLPNNISILNASKWLEPWTLKPINQVVSEELESSPYVYGVISGWMIASDFFNWSPLWAQLWVQSIQDSVFILSIIESERLMIEVSESNITEIELSWSMKNVIAIYCWYLEWKWYPIWTLSYELCDIVKKDMPKLVELLWWKTSLDFSDYSYGWDLLTTVFWESRSKYLWNLLWQWLSLDTALERLKNEHKLSEGYGLLSELLKRTDIYSQVVFLKKLKSILS